MELVYCGSGWLPVVDLIQSRLDARLPGATIRVWDRRGPLADAVRDADVVLPSNAPVGAGALVAADRLALIQQPAAGVEVVDVDAARARGIPVCNAPGANDTAVAEAAVYLMLALARRQHRAQAAFERAEIGAVPGAELRGKTLGIIGLGRSGRRLRAIAEGLGMEVVGVGRTSAAGDWDDLWRRADVVSLHCPLTASTRGLVGAEALARMKPGALVVNCARGPIVDRDAAERALERGALGGLGLDVFWEEPWDPRDPLFSRPDVVVTPHIAGATGEALARIADVVCENAVRVSRGDEPLHRIA